MNRNLQTQIVRVVKLLNELTTIIETKDIGDDTFNYLQDLQNVAISVGTYVETHYENHTSSRLLEEYCELVFQAFSNVENEKLYRKTLHKATILCENIEDAIVSDIDNQPIKILFLPYKASMWDSFASVYSAIKESGVNCRVDVVPIPYYNLRMGEEIIDAMYEGDMFPSNLEVLDYRRYSISDEKPDVVFIHNPYDQYNYVTRVDEKYFSSNLVKYTDHLVYIPYDIVNGDRLENTNFCMEPGVRNAWRVYVQSENIRNQYIQFNEEKKIVALGSPKIDAMINYNPVEGDIFNSWSKVINGRKTFFLNTHLSGLLSNLKTFLENVNYVLNYFEQNQAICLIWRPHPLSIQTIKSMKPDCINQYLHLVYRAKTIRNIIYDETPDMHAAIALSDAYIGEGGSLLTLYGATGKPIYYFNVPLDWTKDDFLNYVHYLSMIPVDKEKWVFSSNYNALFHVTGNQETKFVCAISDEPKYQHAMFYKMLLWEEELFLIPYNCHSLIRFSCKDQKQEAINISSILREGEKIVDAYMNDGVLWMLSSAQDNHIIKYEINERKLLHFTAPDAYCKSDSEVFWCYWIGDRDQRGIWRASNIEKKVSLFNYKKIKSWKVDSIDDNNPGYISCATDGERIWLIPMSGHCITIFNPMTNETIFYNQYPNGFVGGKRPFSQIKYANGCIWLIPHNANMILRIDIENMTCHKVDILDQILYKSDPEYCLFDTAELHENYLYIYSQQQERCIRIDTYTYEIEYEVIRRPQEWDNDWVENYVFFDGNPSKYSTENYIHKSSLCSFDRFVKYVVTDKDDYSQQRKNSILKGILNIDGTAGEKIWDDVYRELLQEET